MNDDERELRRDLRSLRRKVDSLRRAVDQHQRPILLGLAIQDREFLSLAVEHGVDPRKGVRMALGADGELVAVTGREQDLRELLDGIRAGIVSHKLVIEYRLHPSPAEISELDVDGSNALAEGASQSTEHGDKKEEERCRE